MAGDFSPSSAPGGLHMTQPEVSPACGAGKQVHWARRGVYALLAQVRPDAVALVDAFGFDDYLLNSALGRKDGDVYR